mmetsp:Transcript_63200/g.186798  ORF Transcript_63200/g.186798 Transcript_63200/m.186798 type:complete len:92 (-) Transcript_63200:219-494(-)
MQLLLVEKSRPGTKLYVGNVPRSTTGADLKSMFGSCAGCDVSSARVINGDFSLTRQSSKGMRILEIPGKSGAANVTVEDLSACLFNGRARK